MLGWASKFDNRDRGIERVCDESLVRLKVLEETVRIIFNCTVGILTILLGQRGFSGCHDRNTVRVVVRERSSDTPGTTQVLQSY